MTNVRFILISAPPILGGLFYLISLYRALSSSLIRALSAGYNELYPETIGHNMAQYLAQPSFLSIENFLEEKAFYIWMNKFSDVWRLVGGGILFGGPLIPIFHVSYLMWSSKVAHPAVLIISFIIGFLLCIRGVVVWFTESPILELTQTD